MTSPGGSLTGSLLHGVSRFVWLLPLQVYPAPLSEISKPNRLLAITLIHGAGVLAPLDAFAADGIGGEMTYSRPSELKPPNPFPNTRSEIVPSAVRSAAGTGRWR